MSHVRLKFLIWFLCLISCASLLTGCFNNKYDDVSLEDHIKLQLQTDSKLSALPILFVDIPKIEHSIWGELKDPMSRSDVVSIPNESIVITSIKGIDPHRQAGYTPDVLEQFSLDVLVLLGVMIQHDGASVAVFRTPVGTVHQVHVGDYIGDQFEKIILITDTLVKLEKQINQIPLQLETRTILVLGKTSPK